MLNKSFYIKFIFLNKINNIFKISKNNKNFLLLIQNDKTRFGVLINLDGHKLIKKSIM